MTISFIVPSKNEQDCFLVHVFLKGKRIKYKKKNYNTNSNKQGNSHLWQTPLDRSKIVLSRGIAKGSKGSIPTGGQLLPNSIVGAKLE